MAKEGKGNVIALNKGRTRYVSIPAIVASDSQFPFEVGDEVKVSIDAEKKRLLVEKKSD
jgi:hypothetical protein